MRRVQIALGAFCLLTSACDTTPSPAVTSAMPTFWRFYETDFETPEGRLAAFKQDVLATYPNLYGPFVSIPGDEDLSNYLDSLEPFAARMRALEPLIEAEIPRADAQLDRALGPSNETIYLAPSLFTSNGQVRWIGGHAIVLFGADVQAYVEDELMQETGVPDLRAYVLHELFHARHYAANPEVAHAAEALFADEASAPLYQNLWIEGLATCAAHSLAPGGSMARSLQSPDLAENVSPHIQRIAAEMLAKLDSIDPGERGAYFWLQSERADIPARSAYAIGMLVANDILAEHTLSNAMALSGPALRTAIANALTQLAAQPFDGTWSRVCQPRAT